MYLKGKFPSINRNVRGDINCFFVYCCWGLEPRALGFVTELYSQPVWLLSRLRLPKVGSSEGPLLWCFMGDT